MKTNPRHVHGDIRGLGSVRSSQQFEGRFGRMFRTLPPARFDEKDLRSLASKIVAEGKRNRLPKPRPMPKKTPESAPATPTWGSSSTTTLRSTLRVV